MAKKAKSKKTSKPKVEKFEVKGEELLAKVKQLINEGNAKEVINKDKKGRVLIKVPLTVGVVGAVLAPWLAAVGAIAALVSECTVVVKKR
jgi:hypothetical protein